MRVTLVRHTSVDVPAGVCYGQTDVALSATFADEANVVKQKLLQINADIVFSSPLSRCVWLAEFCDVKSVCVDSRLQEMDFGAWEMMRWDGIDDPQLAIWYNDWENEPATNGESFLLLIERVNRFIAELLTLQKEHALIFTHAGVIRAFLIYHHAIKSAKAFEIAVNYGDVLSFDMQ